MNMKPDVICENCGGQISAGSVKWYGRWWLCVQCKARSATTGWFPETGRLPKEMKMESNIVASQKRYFLVEFECSPACEISDEQVAEQLEQCCQPDDEIGVVGFKAFAIENEGLWFSRMAKNGRHYDRDTKTLETANTEHVAMGGKIRFKED